MDSKALYNEQFNRECILYMQTSTPLVTGNVIYMQSSFSLGFNMGGYVHVELPSLEIQQERSCSHKTPRHWDSTGKANVYAELKPLGIQQGSLYTQSFTPFRFREGCTVQSVQQLGWMKFSLGNT